MAEPFVEIHPDDAGRLGIGDAELATVRSASGTVVVRALVTERQRPGTVFVPMHWTDRFASRGRVGALVPGDTDPVSGQPGSKLTPVAVERFAASWYGFAVARARPWAIDAEYWSLAPTRSGWRIELAGTNEVRNGVGLARDLLQPDGGAESDLLAYHDVTSGQHRFACFRDDALLGAVFVGPHPVAVSRSWAAEQLCRTWPTPRERLRLLAGRPAGEEPDPGAIICACFEVGHNQIARAVSAGGCATVDAVGAALSAGTNCGSCRAEIKRLIDDLSIQKAG